mgnify:CR=1 FL=1
MIILRIKIIILIILKSFLNIIGLSNRNKIIYELVGNPGAGKSTLINFLYSNEKEEIFINKNRKKIIFFILTNPFILIYSYYYLNKIIKSFVHDYNKYNKKQLFQRKLKIYKILILMWFKIKNTKSKLIFIESIMHQITDQNICTESLIKILIKCYGNPKFSIIFLDLDINSSMERMSLRGDKINVKDDLTIKRYKKSLAAFNIIFNFISKNYKKNKFLLKPYKINGGDTISINCKYLKKIIEINN